MPHDDPAATRRLKIADLEEKATRRPKGYLSRVLALALPGSHDGQSILVRQSDFEALSLEYRRQMHRKRDPGDLAKILIELATGNTSACSSCDDFSKWMNSLGWWGCLRQRKAIAARLCDEARKRADQLEAEAVTARHRADVARKAADSINPDRALTLILAAARELNQRRREKQK